MSLYNEVCRAGDPRNVASTQTLEAALKPAAASVPTDTPVKSQCAELPPPSARPVPGPNNGTPNPELDKVTDNATDKTIPV